MERGRRPLRPPRPRSLGRALDQRLPQRGGLLFQPRNQRVERLLEGGQTVGEELVGHVRHVDAGLLQIVEDLLGRRPILVHGARGLAVIAEGNLARREAEAAKGRAIVAERTAALWPQVAQTLGRGE